MPQCYHTSAHHISSSRSIKGRREKREKAQSPPSPQKCTKSSRVQQRFVCVCMCMVGVLHCPNCLASFHSTSPQPTPPHIPTPPSSLPLLLQVHVWRVLAGAVHNCRYRNADKQHAEAAYEPSGCGGVNGCACGVRVLCCVVLCCVVLCCVVLCCVVLCCLVLSCVVLCCLVLVYVLGFGVRESSLTRCRYRRSPLCLPVCIPWLPSPLPSPPQHRASLLQASAREHHGGH